MFSCMVCELKNIITSPIIVFWLDEHFVKLKLTSKVVIPITFSILLLQLMILHANEWFVSTKSTLLYVYADTLNLSCKPFFYLSPFFPIPSWSIVRTGYWASQMWHMWYGIHKGGQQKFTDFFIHIWWLTAWEKKVPIPIFWALEQELPPY